MSMPRYLKMSDEDRIGFGKFDGTPMKDVPASYLHYLWHNGMHRKTNSDPVAEYIARNFSALETEDTNLIWEHKP